MAVGAMRMIGVVGVVIACLALRCAAQLDDAEACMEPYAIRLQRNLTLEQSSNAVCFLLNVRCGDVGLGNLTEANILAGDRAESTFTCFGCTSGAHVVIRYRAPTDNERLVAIAILTGLSVLAVIHFILGTVHPPSLRIRPLYPGCMYFVQTNSFDTDLVDGTGRGLVGCCWYVALKNMWLAPPCCIRYACDKDNGGTLCEGDNATWVPRSIALLHSISVSVALGAALAVLTNSLGLNVTCSRNLFPVGPVQDDEYTAGAFSITQSPAQLSGPLTASSAAILGAQVFLVTAFARHFQKIISFFVQTSESAQNSALHCACCAMNRLRDDSRLFCVSRFLGDRLVMLAEAALFLYVSTHALSEVDAVLQLVLTSVVSSTVVQIFQASAVWCIFAAQSRALAFVTPFDPEFYEQYDLDFCGYPKGATACAPCRACGELLFAALHYACCCWCCCCPMLPCCEFCAQHPDMFVPIHYEANLKRQKLIDSADTGETGEAGEGEYEHQGGGGGSYDDHYGNDEQQYLHDSEDDDNHDKAVEPHDEEQQHQAILATSEPEV